MIIIHGWADIRPEHKSRIDEAAKALATKSLKEPGNVHYGLSWHVDQPHRLCLIEVWDDASAHAAHTQEPNVRAFGQLAADSVVAPPSFFRFEGSPDS